MNVLKEYFTLYFKYTMMENDGILTDAFSVGVSVIASYWKYNSEIVNENIGYVYPTGNQASFFHIRKTVTNNPAKILCKKQICLKEAEKDRVDKVIQQLLSNLL